MLESTSAIFLLDSEKSPCLIRESTPENIAVNGAPTVSNAPERPAVTSPRAFLAASVPSPRTHSSVPRVISPSQPDNRPAPVTAIAGPIVDAIVPVCDTAPVTIAVSKLASARSKAPSA